MTPERVTELISAYGADPADWPEAEREAARRLLLDEPAHFVDALEQARQLDAALRQVSEPEIPDGLATKILAHAPSKLSGATRYSGPFAALRRLSGRKYFWPLRVATASLFTGIAAGYGAMAATIDRSPDLEDVFFMALDAPSGLDFEEFEP